jgi:hypothetical protein
LRRSFFGLLLSCCAAACGGSGGSGGDERAAATTTTTLTPPTTTAAPTTTAPFLTTTTMADATTTSQPAAPTTTVPTGPRDTCPANANATCKATFRLKSLATLGGLQFDVDYGAVSGCFKGIADGVRCVPAPQISALASFHDDDPSKRLSVGLVSLAGIPGPVDVAVCDFVGTSVSATHFDFEVVGPWSPICRRPPRCWA